MLVKVDVASLYKGLLPWKKKEEKGHQHFVLDISILSTLQLGKLRHHFSTEWWIYVFLMAPSLVLQVPQPFQHPVT